MAGKDTYTSILAPSEGLYKESGSRFIAYALPVSSVSEAKSAVDSIRKEHFSARHCCFAYRIGHDGAIWRANDDGEPSGTAGRPILGQIDARGLSDVLVVVVRYFGGVKLGVPGLIRAYRAATSDALDKVPPMTKTASEPFRISFPYPVMNDVMKLLKDSALTVRERDFSDGCRIDVDIPLSLREETARKAAMIEGCSIISIKTINNQQYAKESDFREGFFEG